MTRPGAARVEVVTARGDIVVVATRGAYSGKPRPTLVVQSDLFNETHASVTVCPITSDCIDAPLFGSRCRRESERGSTPRLKSWSIKWSACHGRPSRSASGVAKARNSAWLTTHFGGGWRSSDQ